jgi:signal transduction histidine kinase
VGDLDQDALARLAAAVASAFNDELTLLLNQLALLMEEVGGEDPLVDGLRTAQHSAVRCSVITGDLLDYTRRYGHLSRPDFLKRILSPLI